MKHENHENLRIANENLKIMKIIAFQIRITILIKIIEFQFENHENHENLEFSCENHENHENHRIANIIKMLAFHARITTMIAI